MNSRNNVWAAGCAESGQSKRSNIDVERSAYSSSVVRASKSWLTNCHCERPALQPIHRHSIFQSAASATASHRSVSWKRRRFQPGITCSLTVCVVWPS